MTLPFTVHSVLESLTRWQRTSFHPHLVNTSSLLRLLWVIRVNLQIGILTVQSVGSSRLQLQTCHTHDRQGHVLTLMTGEISTCTLRGKSGWDLAGKSVTAQSSAQQSKFT